MSRSREPSSDKTRGGRKGAAKMNEMLDSSVNVGEVEVTPKVKQNSKQSNESTSQTTLDKHVKLKQVDTVTFTPEKFNETMKSFAEQLTKLASKDFIQSEMKKLITQEFLSKKLSELEVCLRDEVKHEIEKVQKEADVLKAKASKLEDTVTTLRTTVSDLETVVDDVTADNIKLLAENEKIRGTLAEREFKLRSHDMEMNEYEQYSRINNIRIYGLDDQKQETPKQTAIKIVKMANDHLGLTLVMNDIDIAHRLGPYRSDGKRPVICRFIQRYVKHDVLKVRRKLNGKSMVIREDLTVKNAKLLERTSDHDSVKTAWSDEGKIFALLMDNKTKIRITHNTDFSKLPVFGKENTS